MSLAGETLLGATTQGASHYLLPEQIQQYWYHWDLAAWIAGCWPAQALWWDHTSWLWSRGYHLPRAPVYCLAPEWFSSAVSCCLCWTWSSGASLWRVWQPGDQMKAPTFGWGVCALSSAACRGGTGLPAQVQAVSATCTSPWITLRSHWSWGSHLVFCIFWTWMRSASSCWACDTLKTLTLHLEMGIKQVCMQGGLLLCCAHLLSLPAGVCVLPCALKVEWAPTDDRTLKSRTCPS